MTQEDTSNGSAVGANEQGKPTPPTNLSSSATPQDPQSPSGGNGQAPKEKLWQKTWFIVLMVIFITPVGIVLLWTAHKPKSKPARIVLTILLVLLCVFDIGISVGASSSTNSQQATQQQSAQSQSQKSATSSSQAAKSDAKVTSITAKWTGSTTAGTTISKGSSMVVTGALDDGSTRTLSSDEYSLSAEATLAAAQDSTVNVVLNSDPSISYALTVHCTSEPQVPTEYKNALTKAQTYSDRMYMSYQGIYDQLTSQYGEGFSAEAAQYAVDNVKADWNKNALMKAKTYQDKMAMSPSAIHDQLVSEYGEKFTEDQADYAIAHLND